MHVKVVHKLYLDIDSLLAKYSPSTFFSFFFFNILMASAFFCQ